ncbi:hypothetical protein MB02_11580 [Croceicoccus estronivorus]|uniref:SDR family NAD(P)-dependent oxidoreductase n=1 Tax=Croceicoccus estronivorus TaxID=1172626 RepID=UPI0008314F9F|nr:SDR family oxidoreductase [Croceicoccus estronivorus]OCC23278.1 hypothetical protein MB02_11580 [Croceicoccus estronivorus]
MGKKSKAGRLEGRIAIVTGGASGLGRATASLLADEGAKVTIADLDEEGGRGVADMVGGTFRRTNVAYSADVDALVAETSATHGMLHIMINNAGICPQSPLVEIDDPTFRQVMGVNFDGVFFGTRAAARVMRNQGCGTIVNTASAGAFMPTENMSVYAAAKSAVVTLTRVAAIELAPLGIRVNAVCPGPMRTGMAAGLTGAARAAFENLSPLGRAADPIEMAQGILFLISDEASYINGHALQVDGGSIAGKRAPVT